VKTHREKFGFPACNEQRRKKKQGISTENFTHAVSRPTPKRHDMYRHRQMLGDRMSRRTFMFSSCLAMINKQTTNIHTARLQKISAGRRINSSAHKHGRVMCLINQS